MKIIFSVLCIICSSILYPQEPDKSSNVVTIKSLHRQFTSILQSPLKHSRVDSLIIKKPNAVFSLMSGDLYVCPPINDKVCALLFTGEGNFKFTPSDEIEKMQLFRFYNKKSLDENFSSVFLLFNDNTYGNLEDKLIFSEKIDPGNYKRKVEEAFEYLFDEDDGFLYRDIAYIFLEGKDSGLFYSHFTDNDGKPMFYEINPMHEEEIRLMRKYNNRFNYKHEVISQFSSFPLKSFSERKKNIIDGEINISKYIIESEIESDLDFSSKARLIFNPKIDNQRWILLNLYPDLEIDSLFLDDITLKYYRGDDSYTVFIECNKPLSRSATYTLDVYYQGDLFKRNELGWISFKSPNFWFPRCSNREKSNFDLTFHIPEKFKFCSVGSEVLNEENDDIITYKYTTKSPIRNASFNVGNYDEYKLEEKDLPPITVYISDYGHNTVGHELAKHGILSKGNMEEKIGADVANSFNLFTHIYGKLPVEKIYITDIPYTHGEAFPGLIHLSWTAFQGIDDEGMVEQFVAHEVAHQWWGIQVDFDSYHDQWLSEAFSEYSGLWYMQLALQDNERFFDVLDEYKESILNNRKYLFGSGQEAGPVWLGYRTHSTDTRGDYYLIIYKKGAWVLHMLRNMLLDLQTMKEDRFENLLKDFFSTYSGKKASTKDFQRIVEKHFGMNMDWFFNQWIYDTAIPDYKFSYKTTETPEGKYKVTCRVQQLNVPDNFKMYINFLIKFEGDRQARLRMEVSGNKPEFDLPLLPLEPAEIIFNDLNSALCNVEYEDWD